MQNALKYTVGISVNNESCLLCWTKQMINMLENHIKIWNDDYLWIIKPNKSKYYIVVINAPRTEPVWVHFFNGSVVL